MIKAEWITAKKDMGTICPCFRKTVKLKKKVKKATLSASAMGVYRPFIDGMRVGNEVLSPGYTTYSKRTQYQSYDVTEYLTKDSAELSLLAGKGWAVGYFGYKDTKCNYADHISVIAWLDVTYEDGKTAHFGTDSTWEVYTSELLDSEIYNGETVDKTAEIKCVGKAKTDATVKTKLIKQVGEKIIEQERVAPAELIVTPEGDRVIDFGQNMTGYVEIRVRGERGGRIVLDHAEILDNHGNFYNENMRAAKNLNIYVLSGGDDVFKPTFSFQGFRYIRLKEFPFDDVDLDMFTAVAVYSDIKRTGYFSCGNEKINQLYHNVLWGQRGNYLDIPTDCPQRDERLGWTGDAQVFTRTAALNFGVKTFFRKWLGDFAAEQDKTGAVPKIIPNIPMFGMQVSSAWSDAACIIPWEIYLAYGDKKMLTEEYPTMEKWVEYIRKAGRYEYLWLDRWHYGDWLAKDDENARESGSTQRDLIASAFYAYSTECLVKAGKALGRDVSEYETLLCNIKNAFHDNFMENGLPCISKIVSLRDEKNRREQPSIKAITQTSLVLILRFGLYKGEEERIKLTDCLVNMIHSNGDRLATGFVGTPYLLHVLSENGHSELAYTLLLQDKIPSWMFAVNHGATTIWERWDSMYEDGTLNSPSMTSFNHYAYGAVADWLYGGAAGIKTLDDGVGYKHISIKPIPSCVLGFVNCRLETEAGGVESNWYYRDDRIHYEFTVPSGSVAEIELNDGLKKTLSGGKYLFVTKA